jgi:hypothetical protein
MPCHPKTKRQDTHRLAPCARGLAQRDRRAGGGVVSGTRQPQLVLCTSVLRATESYLRTSCRRTALPGLGAVNVDGTATPQRRVGHAN